MLRLKRQYEIQDKRRKNLLELGLQLFGIHSYEEVSTDVIAKEAGISKGLMYHYFSSKKKFYAAVVRYASEQLIEAVRPDETKSGSANLRRGLAAYFEFVQKQEPSYRAMMCGGFGADDEIRGSLEEARETLGALILDFIKIEEPGAEYRLAVRSWIGAVEAAALQWLEDRKPSLERVISVLLAGIGAQLRAASLMQPHPLHFDQESQKEFFQILGLSEDAASKG